MFGVGKELMIFKPEACLTGEAGVGMIIADKFSGF